MSTGSAIRVEVLGYPGLYPLGSCTANILYSHQIIPHFSPSQHHPHLTRIFPFHKNRTRKTILPSPFSHPHSLPLVAMFISQNTIQHH